MDDGSTVTDFLPAERARGITIQSAAITFHWPPLKASSIAANAQEIKNKTDSNKPTTLPKSSISHTINLIDTPGHADFTFEVVRSLRILDGAVCILDGVAGVEAQTEKVWSQAAKHHIPRIIYVNKLDRDGAAFGRTVKDVAVRLKGWPAVCQIPWWSKQKDKLVGLGDVVNLRGLRWKGGDGSAIKVVGMSEMSNTEPKFAAEMQRARVALVELLSEHDEEMVEEFLSCEEDHLAIAPTAIISSLRRCVQKSSQAVIPIFAGASFRNIGVQPLLDAVVDLLPSPSERPDPELSVGDKRLGLTHLLDRKANLSAAPSQSGSKKRKGQAKPANPAQHLESCALAFKVVNEARRGVLVYVRVYSGTIKAGALLYNTNLHVAEKAPRLFHMYASDAVEVTALHEGQIGVITGLNHTRTGDTLLVYTNMNPKNGPPSPIDSLQLRPIDIPPPVFFTSIEPQSLLEEKHLADMLEVVLREDPSLKVTLDHESGQTHLAGMGELHLEIAQDRLINDFKVKASAGKVQIGYREAITSASAPCDQTIERKVANKDVKAGCTVSVSPAQDRTDPTTLADSYVNSSALPDNNTVTISIPALNPQGRPFSEETSLPANLPLNTVLTAFRAGASVALARGPKHFYAVHSTHIDITFDLHRHLFPNTSASALSTAARVAITAALKDAAASSTAGSVLMEPVMKVIVSVNESHLGHVVQDLSSARGGQVLSLDGDGDDDDDHQDNNNESGSDGGASTAAVEPLPNIDPARVYAPPDPFAPFAFPDSSSLSSLSLISSSSSTSTSTSASSSSSFEDKTRQIVARVPLKEMVGYLKHLRSLTGGRGTFVMEVDRFERMSAQRQRVLFMEGRGGW